MIARPVSGVTELSLRPAVVASPTSCQPLILGAIRDENVLEGLLC
jgi:hypothetical protein